MTLQGSTRRSFIQTAGAAFSAPLAAAAATVPAAAIDAADPQTTRLEHLEDLHAIHALNQEYARYVNGGAGDSIATLFANPADAHIDPGIQEIATTGLGEHDAIEVAHDRTTAIARLHCSVRVETAIGPDCPLVDMARQQGGGVLRWTEPRVLDIAYVKRGGAWKIQRASFVRSDRRLR